MSLGRGAENSLYNNPTMRLRWKASRVSEGKSSEGLEMPGFSTPPADTGYRTTAQIRGLPLRHRLRAPCYLDNPVQFFDYLRIYLIFGDMLGKSVEALLGHEVGQFKNFKVFLE